MAETAARPWLPPTLRGYQRRWIRADDRLRDAFTLTLMVGLALLAMRLFRLGVLVEQISPGEPDACLALSQDPRPSTVIIEGGAVSRVPVPLLDTLEAVDDDLRAEGVTLLAVGLPQAIAERAALGLVRPRGRGGARPADRERGGGTGWCGAHLRPLDHPVRGRPVGSPFVGVES